MDIPLPIRLRGLGEHGNCSPSGVRKRVLVNFELEKKTILVMMNLIFLSCLYLVIFIRLCTSYRLFQLRVASSETQ